MFLRFSVCMLLSLYLTFNLGCGKYVRTYTLQNIKLGIKVANHELMKLSYSRDAITFDDKNVLYKSTYIGIPFMCCCSVLYANFI